MKYIQKKSVIIILPLIILLNGCTYLPKQERSFPVINEPIVSVKPISNAPQMAMITDVVRMTKPKINNPFNHQIEYKYTTYRGQIIVDDKDITYYAPFTSGQDNITISVFDKTDNNEVFSTSMNIKVYGSSMVYIENDPKNKLKENENGKIKFVSRDLPRMNKDLDLGRTPTMSFEGKYISYVKYAENGTSQIIVKDTSGKEANITDDDSINKDPAFASMDYSAKLNTTDQFIIFSSNRNINNSNPDRKFHLWRVNINTKELTQLTKGDGNDIQPNCSSNGTIIFSSSMFDNKESDIYNIQILDIKNGDRLQITTEKEKGYGAFNPKWYPAKNNVVYVRKYKKTMLNKEKNLQKLWMIENANNTEGFGKPITKGDDETILESYPTFGAGSFNELSEDRIGLIIEKDGLSAINRVNISPIDKISETYQDSILGEIRNIDQLAFISNSLYQVPSNYSSMSSNPFY